MLIVGDALQILLLLLLLQKISIRNASVRSSEFIGPEHVSNAFVLSHIGLCQLHDILAERCNAIFAHIARLTVSQPIC